MLKIVKLDPWGRGWQVVILVNFIPRLHGKNVPAKRDKYQKGVFDPCFLIISAEKKQENLENNMDDQKVKILLLTVTTQNLCAFMTMTKNQMPCLGVQESIYLYVTCLKVKSYCCTKKTKNTKIVVV